MRPIPSRYRPYLWIGASLVAVEIGIWAVGAGLDNTARLRTLLIHLAGFWPGLLGDWQANFSLQPITMFATYWLLHAGPGHLFGNLAVIAWFAHRIGPTLRPAETWEVWTASVLGGATAFGMMSHSYAPMVGASGGVFGLLGAFIVVDYAAARSRHGLTRSVLRSLAACAAIAILSIGDYLLRDAVLAWQAHLGGFIAGAAITAANTPWRRNETAAK